MTPLIPHRSVSSTYVVSATPSCLLKTAWMWRRSMHTQTGCLPHESATALFSRHARVEASALQRDQPGEQCLPNIGIAVIDTIRHLRPMVPGFAAGTVCPVGQTLPQLRPSGTSRRSRHGLTVSDGARFFIRTTTHRLMMVSGRSSSPAITTAQYAGSSSVSTVLPRSRNVPRRPRYGARH